MAEIINFSEFVAVSKDISTFDSFKVEQGQLMSRSYDLKDFFGMRKERNREVLQLFKKAVVSEFGKKRAESVCRRYAMDLSSMEESGAPLTRKIIDKIRVGVSEVFVSDLSGIEGVQQARWLTPEQIHKKVAVLRQQAFTKEDLPDLSWYGLFFNGIAREANFFFDKTKCLLWPKLSNISYRSYLESLTKWMGYLELQEGSLVPAPSMQGTTDYYEVYKKISAEGLVAYALRPVSAFSLLKPLIVFRPTVTTLAGEDVLYTYLNDFEVHLGSMGYHAAEEKLSALMADPAFCPPGRKIDGAGYSLGGVFLQRLLAKHWKKIDGVFTFNAPSVESSLAGQFATEINSQPADSTEVPSRIEIFRTQGDVAHYVGEKHLGWGVGHPKVQKELLEVDFVERAAEEHFSIVTHLARHIHLFLLDRTLFFIAQRQSRESIDDQLDNTMVTSPGIYWEHLRITVGSLLLFPIIYMMNKAFLSLHKYLHLSILRYSSPQQEYIVPLKKIVARIISSENENTSLVQ